MRLDASALEGPYLEANRATNMQSVFIWVLEHSEAVVTFVVTCLLLILGMIARQRTKIIYKQPTKEGYADFRDSGSQTYAKSGPIGAVGEGQTRVLKDGIIEIRRTNTDGRWVLQFQSFRSDDGQGLAYIPARSEAGGQRSFDVSLEARAIRGPHKLRVVFRTYPDQEFIQDAYMLVEPDKWQKFGRLMIPRADKDMYFFLESPAQTVVSSVQFRKLVLTEKIPGLRFDWLIRLLKLFPHREIDRDG